MSWLRIGWVACSCLVLALAPLTAQEGEETDLPEVSAPAEGDAPALPSIEDRAAFLQKIVVTEPEDEDVVRITISLSYPKLALESKFDGPGAFRVQLDRTAPAPKLPTRILIAKGPVADVRLTTESSTTYVTVRLNTPTRCRAYAIPSKKQIIIDCAEVEPPPAKTGEGEGEGDGEGEGEFGNQNVTVEFVDTDIRVIVEALVAQSGANIMLLPGVAGTYSLALKDVSLTAALDALWEAWDLLWMKMPGSIYLVGTVSELGDKRADVDLDLPQGWTAEDAWAFLIVEYPTLRLRRELRDVAAEGPLPVYGSLRVVGDARRWLAGLPPREEGAPRPEPPFQARDETTIYYPKVVEISILVEQLRAQFPDLTIEPDEAAGRIELKGNRRDVYGARRMLGQIDQTPVKDVEEAMFFPRLEADRIEALAKVSGVEATVIYSDAEGTLAYVKGTETKVTALRKLVEQLQAIHERKDQAETGDGQVVVSRTYDLETLTPDQVARIVADTGQPVSTTIDGLTLTVSGRADRVATVLAAISRADATRVHRVYKVKYARVQDLVRLVRATVPELRTVDYQWQTRPGEDEVLDPDRLEQPSLPVAAVTAPTTANDADTKTQLGPAPGASQSVAAGPNERRTETVGPSPRLILIGSEEAVAKALAFLAEVDVPPAEVELQAVIAELSPTLAAELEVGLTARDGFRLGASANLADLAAAAAKIEADPGSRLLARPGLRTVDGDTARLLIGQRIHFATAAQVEGQPPTPREERVGVILEVAPTVPGDGTIVCRLHPEVSRIEGTGPGGWPQIGTREADATVRVADGGTIVIAGLSELPEQPGKEPARELVVLLAARILPAAGG